MAEALSDRCLRENEDAFAQMVDHRFVRDIAADRVPAAVFNRYLQIEGAFVATAIAIFAHATAKADKITDRRKLIAVQDVLANEQIPYFEKVVARRGTQPDPVLAGDARVIAFDRGMYEIAATGALPEIYAAMFSAEWMYLTWCRRVSTAEISDPDIRAWIDLHTDAAFEAQAHWLKGRLDALGENLDEEARARCVRIFGRVQALERAFHDAPYDG